MLVARFARGDDSASKPQSCSSRQIGPSTYPQFGFPAWSSMEMDPCHICPAPLGEFYSVDGLTPLGMRHPSKTLHNYFDACDRCKLMVAINREQHTAVRGTLWWDKRKETSASHGRGLRHDIPSLGLLRNDRLEPWEGMLDVGEFDSWDAFPRTVLFWRTSRQTSTKHRNPHIFGHHWNSTQY